jgi:phospholipid/cholesterol/gamma-HCH transport system permease protein
MSLSALATLGRCSAFAASLFGRLVRPRTRMSICVHETCRHAQMTTLRCILPVFAVNLPFGMVIALQGLEIFGLFGAERMLSSLISVAVLRELSPVLASVLVAAQGGSSAAAELGAMRIRQEIDATEVMGVDALQIHVLPRVLALTLACPLLNVVGSFAGLLGGYITAVLIKGEPGGIYLDQLWAFTEPMDIWGGIMKTTIFGLVIGLCAAWHGFHAQGGAAGVGKAVNDTVVHSVLIFITLNYFLTSILFSGALL